MIRPMNKPNAIPLTGAQYEIQAGGYRATLTEARRRTAQAQPRRQAADHGVRAGPVAAARRWPAARPLAEPDRRRQVHLQRTVVPARAQRARPRQRDPRPDPLGELGTGPAADIADEITLNHVLLGRPGYPFCLELSVNYRLHDSDGLTISITARTPAPPPPRTAPAAIRTSPPAPRRSMAASLTCRPRSGCPPTIAASRRARRRT